MKKIFYLMRHGQTHANAQHDVPKEKMFLLTELGIQQAKQTGIYLKTMGLNNSLIKSKQNYTFVIDYV